MSHGLLLLLTWTLLVSVQTLRCSPAQCTPVPHATVAPRQASVFASREGCEETRQALLQQHPPVVVQSSGRGTVTVRKEMTFTCRLGGVD